MSQFDVIVVGSGVAGLSIAERLSKSSLNVALVTKATVSDSTTLWAQGGVAAVLGNDDDSIEDHIGDTLSAGAGLCDAEAVRVLIEEGPAAVVDLINLGASFDRSDGGDYLLAIEGGHSHARVLHAGGAATGVEVQRTLVDALHVSPVTVFEHHMATELRVGNSGIEGLSARDIKGETHEFRAPHVVLATGGAGQLFAVTTNPSEATGDGIALALRAQVAVADVEFMQFHPTALHASIAPRPLLSEALRGEGAILRDGNGEQFVNELSPRDVVSRAMATTMAEQDRNHLWLDATSIDRFAERFPSLSVRLDSVSLDPSVDWIPVAPAAHHWAGGVMTDLSGATMLDGLWAIGEVANTGVHGANRLASNSLLEGLVFGARAAGAILNGTRQCSSSGVLRALMNPGSTSINTVSSVDPDGLFANQQFGIGESRMSIQERRLLLQETMTRCAGVVRDAGSLAEAWEIIFKLGQGLDREAQTFEEVELRNLVASTQVLLTSAMQREESRGAHVRREYPLQDPNWEQRIVHDHQFSGDNV